MSRGARSAGMQAALIDRYGRQDPDQHAVPVFRDLHEFVDAVLALTLERAGTR